MGMPLAARAGRRRAQLVSAMLLPRVGATSSMKATCGGPSASGAQLVACSNTAASSSAWRRRLAVRRCSHVSVAPGAGSSSSGSARATPLATRASMLDSTGAAPRRWLSNARMMPLQWLPNWRWKQPPGKLMSWNVSRNRLTANTPATEPGGAQLAVCRAHPAS